MPDIFPNWWIANLACWLKWNTKFMIAIDRSKLISFSLSLVLSRFLTNILFNPIKAVKKFLFNFHVISSLDITRYYITNWNLWACLTLSIHRCIRRCNNCTCNFKLYFQFRRWLSNYIYLIKFLVVLSRHKFIIYLVEQHKSIPAALFSSHFCCCCLRFVFVFWYRHWNQCNPEPFICWAKNMTWHK